jgi:tetratricopeptide (TPR) repeat protein
MRAGHEELTMPIRWSIVPSHQELTFLLEAGIIYRDAKKFQAAIDVFEGVKNLLPQHELPEILLGTVDFQQSRFEAAEAHYRRALELNSRSAFAHALFGESCLFRKDKVAARTHLKAALGLDPLGESGKMARRLMELTDQVSFA